MTITYYVPLKNSCHVWGFLPSWSWEGSCWLGPLRLSILSQSTREADPPLDEQLFWERRTRKEKGTHYKESAERSHLPPPPPSTTCQQKALSVWHTHALLPTIPGHFKGVLLRSKSSGLPTALSHRRTLDANISRIFVHLSNSWKSPPTNPALFFIPTVREGVGQKAARHPGTQTSTCLMRTHLASAPRERTARARQIIFQPLPNEVDSPSTVCFHVWKPSLKHDYATKGPHRRSTLKHTAYQ